MISEILTTQLKNAALKYEIPDFIKQDPIQFPHRFTEKCDIEISGLLTALMSFGNRKQIITKAEQLHEMMRGCPKEYILSGAYTKDFPTDKRDSFYRMMSYAKFRKIFDKLFNIYLYFNDLESYMNTFNGIPMERMCNILSVSCKSPQKKINMFLRWMIRRNSCVDFGIWKSFSPSELIIPLDTHVAQTAFEMGIIDKISYSIQTAIKITETLRLVFPEDPVKGDFSLFGTGTNPQ